MITNEKRAYNRVKMALAISYRTFSPRKSVSGNSITHNISFGGVYFETLTELLIGELLDCTIEIREKNMFLRFLSRVVRCESLVSTMLPTFGVAAEFVTPFEKSDVELRKVLS
ncbi:MAG: PilZ domain-containing protein [Candidatus Omnitrophota bacterium]